MLVLAALALVSFVVLAIMTFVRSEDRSARAAADLVQVRMLSSLPEKVVISQIRRATGKPTVDAQRGLANDSTWTSQPGAIRVFGTDPDGTKPRSKMLELRKLYSARQLTVSAAEAEQDLTNELALMQDWRNRPPEFVDLNEPVRVEPMRRLGSGRSPDKPYFVFPILDPDAKDLVDGFEVYTSDTALDGAATPSKAPNQSFSQTTAGLSPVMAMPVTWMYVLQDGSILAPSNSKQGTAEFGMGASAGKPTQDNPIVGRIAYWTDDESCKLNLNTATEPSPWEPPHTHTGTDVTRANSIPAKGEYYRSSGHPTYTSLSPVLRHFQKHDALTVEPMREPDSSEDGTSWSQHLKSWHSLLPRTFDPTSYTSGVNLGTQQTPNEVTLKNERLFASVDELIFNTSPASVGQGRFDNTPTTAADPSLNADDLSKVRFFLTTHSRAPELNLYNRPKISLWPMFENDANRTTTDKKLALASSLNGPQLRPYYFQREFDSSYLSALTGGTDTAITRNKELLGYLQQLTEWAAPGFGGSFAPGQNTTSAQGKWTPDGRDQLLISMFDFLRWGANTTSTANRFFPPQMSAGGNATDGAGAGQAVPSRLDSNGAYNVRGETSASDPTAHTKAFGRFPTITQAAIVFVASDAMALPGSQALFAEITKKVQAYVILEPFNPAPGVVPLAPLFSCRLRGLDQFSLGDQSLNFKSEVVTHFTCPQGRAGSSGTQWDGDHSAYVGMVSQFLQANGKPKAINSNGANDEFATFTAVSDVVALPRLPPAIPDKPIPKIRFSSSRNNIVTLEISALHLDGSNTTEPVQTIELQFPNTDIPVPLMIREGNVADQQLDHRIASMINTGIVAGPKGLIQPGDVIRSVVLAGTGPVHKAGDINGDARMLAGRVHIAATDHYLVPSLFYFSADGAENQPDMMKEAIMAQGLRDGAHVPTIPPAMPSGIPMGLPFQLAMQSADGKLKPIPYPPNVPPAVPMFSQGAINADGLRGDFDNGLGITEDGPYINMLDSNSSANQSAAANGTSLRTNNIGGYFDRGGLNKDESGITFSPWRQISSAIAFGSLPTGVYGWTGAPNVARPWQTLLFCPNPASRTTPAGTEPDFTNNKDHFGFLTPRDHLWLENFWMPAADPDGLSEGFSTEGKVNMNYQIMPFLWIKRATAMHGALQGVRVTAIPNKSVGTYKDPSTISTQELHYAVDPDKTLAAFEDRFYDPGTKTHDVFRSPSEICEMFLIPKRLKDHDYTGNSGATPPDPMTVCPDGKHEAYTNVLDWWKGTGQADGFDATGDNLREAPYAQLYPRLCTRSNVFTVHYRVQLLRKSRSTAVDTWVEGKDQVVAEYRGQSTIERYLDPSTKTLPDFATSTLPTEAVDDYYKYRVINRRQFAP